MELSIIQSKIYTIRGQKVMLDRDLAEMYGTETKYLKRAVKANIKRFPPDFLFELTKEEWSFLRCNFSTSNQRGGTRYMPYAFSEQGVAMLSGILSSDVAIEMNIAIMRAFVAVRQLLSTPPVDRIGVLETTVNELRQYMEEILIDQNYINEDTRTQLEIINQTLAEMQTEKRLSDKPRRPIGYIKFEEEKTPQNQ
jgi:hypothetical protein